MPLVNPKDIMKTYNCDFDTAEHYCDLREEGYSVFQAKVLSGICSAQEFAVAECANTEEAA